MPHYGIYIAVHVKDPPTSNMSSWIWTPYGPSWIRLLDRSVEIRLMFLGWTSSIFYQQQLGRPVDHMPPPPSVSHPGLPDLDNVVGIPMKYTHNSSPRSSSRFNIPPSSFLFGSGENLEELPKLHRFRLHSTRNHSFFCNGNYAESSPHTAHDFLISRAKFSVKRTFPG